MKKSNQKKEYSDDCYIPFDLDKTKKKYILDSILILGDGSHFYGKSFGSKKRSSGEFVLIHLILATKK